MASEKHWVEDLFPPHFSYANTEELTKSIELAAQQSGSGKLPNRINPEDTSALQSIYKRALEMVIAQEREKNQLEVIRCVEGSTQTDISVCDGLPMKREDYQVDSETYTQDCVWTESEMSLLWQHYRSEHAEYIKTKSYIKCLNKEIAELTARLDGAKLDSHQSDNALHSTESQVNRLKEVNQSLRAEIVRITRQLRTCERELKEEKVHHREQSSKLRDTAQQLAQLEMRTKLQDAELQVIRDEVLQDAERTTSALKLRYEAEIADLSERVEKLSDDLQEERSLHERSRRGLELLQAHYSQSQAVSDVVDTRLILPKQ